MNVAGCAVSVPSVSIGCQAYGAELLTPPLDNEVVCREFRAALANSLGAGGTKDIIRVRLDIKSSSVISAEVTLTRAGTAAVTHPPLNLVVSDRSLQLIDLDRLAAALVKHLGY